MRSWRSFVGRAAWERGGRSAVIVVDTSALIDSLVGPRRSAPRMRALIEEGERLVLPTLVLDECWRGPRRSEGLAAQEALFPQRGGASVRDRAGAGRGALHGLVNRVDGKSSTVILASWSMNPIVRVRMPSRVGERGQITVEKAIREELAVYAGDDAVQWVEDGHLVVAFVPGSHTRSLAGSLANKVTRRPATSDWAPIRDAARAMPDPDRIAADLERVARDPGRRWG
jgi:hypothetical protein